MPTDKGPWNWEKIPVTSEFEIDEILEWIVDQGIILDEIKIRIHASSKIVANISAFGRRFDGRP